MPDVFPAVWAGASPPTRSQRLRRAFLRRWFTAGSYVPGTRPWRVYRDATGWVDVARHQIHAATGQPVFPAGRLPRAPRDPVTLAWAINQLMLLLAAIEAVEEGRWVAASEFLVSDEESLP